MQYSRFLLVIYFIYIYESESESPSVVADSFRPLGILQARILEWVSSPFSRGSSRPRDPTQVSHMSGGFFLWTEDPGRLQSMSHIYFIYNSAYVSIAIYLMPLFNSPLVTICLVAKSVSLLLTPLLRTMVSLGNTGIT